MALIHCDFFAETLGLSTSATVLLPRSAQARTASRKARRLPVLYLLHGLSDDHTVWQRRTSIERYVDPLNLAVVMPAVGRSYYCDMAHGLKYWTFLSEELPRLMQSFFPLSARREDTFAAGLSMGGMGAMKLGLTHPERFAAVASLSGAIDPLSSVRRHATDRPVEMRDIFGDPRKLAGGPNDLFAMAARLRRAGERLPRLFLCCGEQDFLWEDNVRLKSHLEKLGVPFTWRQGPGSHEWSYWDAEIQNVLKWLPLRGAR